MTYNTDGGASTPGNGTSTRTFSGRTITGNSVPASTISGTILTIAANAVGNIGLQAVWNAQPNVTLPAAIVKTGHTFSGWNTAINCGGTRVGGAGGSYAPTGNITLYACYTVNTYTISVDANGGNAGTNGSYTFST